MIKKGISLIFAIFFISNVSASSLDYFFDMNSIIFAGLFFIVFYTSYIAINKSMTETNAGIKMVLSLSIALFTIWKAYSSDIRIDAFLFDYGLTGTLEAYGPIIIIAGILIAMWKWGMCGVLAIVGSVITLVGYIGQESGILYNGWALVYIGIGMMALGSICLYKKAKKFIDIMKKQKIKSCGLLALLGFILIATGLIIGELIISGIGLVIWIFAEICPKGKSKSFDYRAGMRRGGIKSTRSRFVSRESVKRYARRFGNATARNRFN